MSYLEMALKAKKQIDSNGSIYSVGDCNHGHERNELNEIRYADRLRAALLSVCTPDYPAGMVPWLGQHRSDLYNLLVNAIPDKLNKIWANNGSLEHFEAALATWKDAHAEAVRTYRNTMRLQVTDTRGHKSL